MIRMIKPAAIILLVISLIACSSGVKESDPRQVVIKIFGAMESGNRDILARFLDFGQLLNPNNRDITLKTDSVRNFGSPDELLDDLLEGGVTYDRWFAMQRVVGQAEQKGDTALVEVSFISQKTGKQYYNKWGLHKVEGMWKVYSFATMNGDEE